ncbi:hypothetical protein [Kosmotoga pacifica]|uniref:hypothetical protein n=1 Tax=Kosmotoga pacifica TaxID=1330330 RepID=UPI000A6D4A79|nr:hypothetical protein [Kosmotoga pacifica]
MKGKISIFQKFHFPLEKLRKRDSGKTVVGCRLLVVGCRLYVITRIEKSEFGIWKMRSGGTRVNRAFN